MPDSPSLLDYVRAHLLERKGTWRTISKETGVPQSTVQRIAHGTNPNVRIRNVEKLANYFRARTAKLEEFDPSHDRPAA